MSSRRGAVEQGKIDVWLWPFLKRASHTVESIRGFLVMGRDSKSSTKNDADLAMMLGSCEVFSGPSNEALGWV